MHLRCGAHTLPTGSLLGILPAAGSPPAFEMCSWVENIQSIASGEKGGSSDSLRTSEECNVCFENWGYLFSRINRSSTERHCIYMQNYPWHWMELTLQMEMKCIWLHVKWNNEGMPLWLTSTSLSATFTGFPIRPFNVSEPITCTEQSLLVRGTRISATPDASQNMFNCVLSNH